MLLRSPSPLRRTTDALLLGIIAAQPALDSLTYWLMTTGRTNWVAYGRAAALGLFGALVLLQNNGFDAAKEKRRRWQCIGRWLLAAVWGLYVLGKYPLAAMLLPGSAFNETANMLRTMIAPMFTLWLFWHVQEDPAGGAGTISTGLLWAAGILAVLSAASFVTGTYNVTYNYQLLENMPQVHIGFSAWNYSSNAQSIVMAVLLALCAPMLAQWRRPWAFLALLAAFGVMMYFQGTRTAYYAMLAVGAALAAALLLQFLRRRPVRWWALTAAVALVVLGLALKPLSPLETVQQSRQRIRSIADYLQQGLLIQNPDAQHKELLKIDPSATQAATEQPVPAPTATAQGAVAAQASASPPAMAQTAPPAEPSVTEPPAAPPPALASWDADFRSEVAMFYFPQVNRDGLYSLRQRARYDTARMDAAAYRYLQQRLALPSAQLVDMRRGHRLYVAAAMEHADALRRFTGFGVTWFNDVLGSVEDDYAAVYGYFGILGCLVVFGVVAWALWMALRCLRGGLRWRRLRRFLTPEILMDAGLLAMLLGLARFSGRVFQQGSVSIYLALALALFYCHIRVAAQRTSDDEP